MGAEPPVKAGIGWRNTVFNALTQTGAECVKRMIALGARNFPPRVLARIEIAESTRRHARVDGRREEMINLGR